VSPRLRRFLHLERPRGPDAAGDGGGEGDRPAPGGGRFDGVAPPVPRAPSPAPRSGAQLDRFGPEPDPTIELVDTEARRLFTRCMRCGADSNVFATECAGCGTNLDTAAQHEFNERFWIRHQAERQAEAEREARAAAERRELAARAGAEEARARRELAEALAREVGDRERRRVEADDRLWSRRAGHGWGWGGWEPGLDSRPLGLRLIQLLPGPRSQLAAAVAAAAAVLGSLGYGIARLAQGQKNPWFPLGLLLLVLLVSPGWRRWHRW
jgi:hypothetical protein